MAEKTPLKKTKGKSEGISKKPYRPKPLTEKEKIRMREEFKRQQKPYRYSDKDMTDEEKRRMIYLTKDGHRDPGHMERMMEFERSLREAGLDGADNSKMMDGGMARGKGGKMYQHNYATGGSVTDHLKSVPADNKGLGKLPKEVRNKMGYMSYGGMAKKKGGK